MSLVASSKIPSAKFTNFDSFWLYYLRAHSKISTRACHYAGALIAFAVFVLACFIDILLALACPAIGLGVAVLGHVVFEHNKPTLLRYPLWSILSGLKMQYLWLTGQLEPQLIRALGPAGKSPRGLSRHAL